MADWTLIADSALDPDAPLTSDLAYAWRDNPIAISEGSPGAPKNMGISLDDVFRGAYVTAGTSATDFIGLQRAKTIMLDFVAVSGGSVNLNIAFSNNNGSSFAGAQILVNGFSSGAISKVQVVFDMETGVFSVRGNYDITGATTPGVIVQSGTLTVPANCDAFRLTGSGGTLTSTSGHAFILGGVA